MKEEMREEEGRREKRGRGEEDGRREGEYGQVKSNTRR